MMAALSLGGFHILMIIEVALDANNVLLSVEKLEVIHAETNFSLAALKNVCSVNSATGRYTSSPMMQGTFWR
jgi:hypothetical protein